MAKAPAKKKAAAKAAPSSTKIIKRRNAVVTFGKGVAVGKRVR